MTSYRFDEDRIETELESMTGIVDMRYTEEVKSYIHSYLVRNRSRAEEILSRMMLYFPMIENQLDAHDLPEELKYVAVIESALHPCARSRVGATGLWQIMSPTARDLGLRIYHSVDERMDPFASTEAALRYLSELYDRFGNWELALAAYNAGPGRVSSVLRQSGKSSYWEIRDKLSKETANYIPAYIAAFYVFSRFNEHGLIPERSHPDLHFTSKIEIFNHKLYLDDIADVLHINLDYLRALNPMYKKYYIPKSENGYNLIIPIRCIEYVKKLQDTLGRTDFIRLADLTKDHSYFLPLPDSMQDRYMQVEYVVRPKENLFSVSRTFELDIHQLRYWNNLSSLQVDHGMLIDVPIPIMKEKFLLTEYRQTPIIRSLRGPECISVQVAPEDLRCYQLASQQLVELRAAYVQSCSMSSCRIIKGLPIQYQMKDKRVNTDACLDFTPGLMVSSN